MEVGSVLSIKEIKDVIEAIVTASKLADEVQKLMEKHLPPNASKVEVVVDARFIDSSRLSVYSFSELSEKFDGWIVRPRVGIELDGGEDEIIELLEEKYAELGPGEEVVFAIQQSVGISLFRVFVDERHLKNIGDKSALKYVGTFKTACRDAERVINMLTLMGAELHTGIELTIGGLRRYLPFRTTFLRRSLDRICGHRENYGIADYIMRYGRLYIALTHTCSLRLPEVLEKLGLCS